MSDPGVTVVSYSDAARDVRHALLSHEGEDTPMSALAEIATVFVDPMDVERGDYIHRPGRRSLKVTGAPKRMGLVVRIPGMTTDSGLQAHFTDHELQVCVTRGYPAGTLPEEDPFPHDFEFEPEAE